MDAVADAIIGTNGADMTPDQDKILRDTFNLSAATNGAVGALDGVIRDTYNAATETLGVLRLVDEKINTIIQHLNITVD